MKAAPLNSELEVVFHPGSSPALKRPLQETLVGRLRLLLARRRVLARFVLIGTVLATIQALIAPPRFESVVRLMPPDSQGSSGVAMLAGLAARMGSAAGVAGDLFGLKSSGALFVGILTSRTVQDDLVQKYDLQKVYRLRYRELARKRLAANTSISEDRKSGILTVTVFDGDPQRAAQLAGEYVAELNTVVSQVSTSSARREREFLEGRLREVRQDLESAERDFGDYASKNTAIDIKEQARAMLTAAATLQGQLIASQSQLEGLRQIYADDHIRIRSLRAHIAELQSQLAKLGGNYENPNDPSKVADNSPYPSIRKLPVLGISYADLYRRTRVQEAVFETLTQQYELAKVAEAKEIPSVKLLDPPDVPERKVAPSRRFIVFMGIFLSFAFGSIWVLARDYWERMDPEAPGKLLVMESVDAMRGAVPKTIRRKLWPQWRQSA